MYGATKQLNEFMARKYATAYGMFVVGVRVSVVIGAGRKAGNVAPTMVAALPAVGQPVVIPFRPDQRALLIHVDDVAEIFARLCNAVRIRHPIYHTGGHTCTFSDEAYIVRSFIPEANISFATSPVDLPLVYLVDSTRLQEEFGFRHAPLEQSVLDVMNWTRRTSGLPPVA